MNQILMTENKKKKGYSSQVGIRNIVMFFAIVIIVFGMFLIGQGSYAIYKESKGNNTKDLPTISVSRINDTAIISVNSIERITNFKYSWNNAEQTVIPIDANSLEEEIFLPNENSVLNIVVENESGRAVKYQKEFIVEGMDLAKPSIEISEEETKGNIKIAATDETKMSYITYKINNQEEIRVDRAEGEEKTINYVLRLERGENKLVITAVDTSRNIETMEKTIILSQLPTINLIQNANMLTVIVKDTDGIKDVEINLNGVIYAGKDINQKEIQIPLELKEGANTVQIKVTNINGLVTEGVKELNYAH